MFQVIAVRAEKAAVIVTTNLPFSEWSQVIPSVGEHGAMMASTLADNVSTPAAPLAANPSRNSRCLRARPPMIASAYS
jgi:hypothetical protein